MASSLDDLRDFAIRSLTTTFHTVAVLTLVLYDATLLSDRVIHFYRYCVGVPSFLLCLLTGHEFINPLCSVINIAILGAGTLLTIYRLYKSLGDISSTYRSIWPRLAHVKHFTPVFWTFYLDGTLFFFPMLAMEIAGSLGSFRIPLGQGDWSMWKWAVQYISITRLLLNLHEASKGMKDSIVTQEMSTLRFGNFQDGQDQTANEEIDGTGEVDIEESATRNTG
ncbi:hypothetical protein D9756_008058 [Leucocoprinus leucothites]|uniref:Uncharacterized protein n=1 Tax=Leucocoprinus leucothites TaxID=201217 RepID=A0A8H5FY38_9AGAR|nr:hypothetical protein D9756_008058 [Leucoagaricus leucothites]